MAASSKASSAKRRGRVDTTVDNLEEDVENHDKRLTRLEAFALTAGGYLARDAGIDLVDIITTII